MDSPQAPKQPIELVKHRALAVWLLFVLIASAKVFAVRWLILDSTSVLGALSDVLFVVAVFTVADLFFADMRFRAYMIADVLLTVLLFAIAVYSEYYQLLPTRESLAALGMAGDVKTSISELLTPLYLLFFIDIPLLMLWGARARRRGVDVVTSARNGAPVAPGHRIPYVYQRRFVYVVGAIALVGFLWNVNSIRTISEPVDGNAMSRQRGLTTYLAASAFGSKANAAEHKVEGTVAEIQDQIDGLRGAQTSTTIDGFVRGSAAGSNVIVIQVEAMQGAVIGARVGGVEVTPNLNKLIARSWYYPNHMSQVGRGTTADAEFASTTSAYPPGVGAASLLYVDRELPSMPRTLEATGYDAVTFHTNNAEFWNRTQLYPAIGYGEYYDSKFFKDEDKIGFGSSDKVLFAKALDELQTRDKAGKRFYAQLVTVTSHFPFTQVPVEERDLDVVPPYTGTIEGDYLTEMKYTDAAIGKFLDDLDAAGLLDKSIVVIYGDHFGLPEPRKAAEEDAIRDLLGHDYEPLDRLRTPFIIHLPKQAAGVRVDTPISQLDLAPTIADALGVELSSMPHFGRSAFSAAPAFFAAGGLLPVGSYVDDNVLYIPGDTFEQGEAWDVHTGKAAAVTSASPEKQSSVKQLLQLSDRYVRSLPRRDGYDPNAKMVIPSDE